MHPAVYKTFVLTSIENGATSGSAQQSMAPEHIHLEQLAIIPMHPEANTHSFQQNIGALKCAGIDLANQLG